MRRVFLALAFLPGLAAATVHYSFKPNPAAGTATVTVGLDQSAETETFRIPAWTPGYYYIEHFEEKIFDVRAADAKGTALKIDHDDPRAWKVENPAKGPVTLSYKVLGDDEGLGFFAVSVRPTTAYVNGAAAFMYVEGRKEEDATLRLNLPAGWNVATGMDRAPSGDYHESNYDAFIDQPVQMGQFERRTFKVDDIPFEAVFATPEAKIDCDVDAETERLRRVSKPAIDMFGGAPFHHYVYIFHLQVGGFSGGLEHRASTVIAVPNVKPLDIDDLAAHEFFHAWNVKQIRPAVLGPFDYTKEVRTGNLWFAEGVTDYYAKLLTYRSGLEDETWLLDQLGTQIATLQMSHVRKTATVEEASRESWRNGGDGLGDLSYYTKGLVAGFVLDAAIRSATGGKRSLDDVMRLMYDRYRLPHPGYGDDAIRAAINEVAGKDLGSLYDRIVRSTQEVPYDVVQGIGLEVVHGATPSDPWEVRRDPKADAAAKARLAEWLQANPPVHR